MNTLLVLDSSYLCHRAFHSTRQLSFRGEATGVVFGFLKDIHSLKEEFQTDRIAFCFEGQKSFRKEIYPDYKAKRYLKEQTPEQQKARKEFRDQILHLQYQYLPQIGFKNIFSYDGYESDDVMAQIAANHKADRVMMVTEDQDMFQCLDSNVSMFSPFKMKIWTIDWFVHKYGIQPFQWAVVKAIAGCQTDNVKGVHGVGEGTALLFLQGRLSSSHHRFPWILSREGKRIVRRNRALVELPMDGCPVPQIQDDEISEKGWKAVCSQLGFKSMAGRLPMLRK